MFAFKVTYCFSCDIIKLNNKNNGGLSMEKMYLMNEFIKKTVKTKNWFILFPFAIVASVLWLVYYIVMSVYLLFDLLVVETKRVLRKDSEDESNLVHAVKHFLGFFFVVYFNLISVFLSLVLAILYFLSTIFIFISSVGKVKNNPYGFHTI